MKWKRLLSFRNVCTADTYPRASLCEEAGSVCVIRTVRGVGGGDVSHLMVALSSRPSSSTAAIWGTRANNGALDDPRIRVNHLRVITATFLLNYTVCTFLLCFLRSLGCWAERKKDKSSQYPCVKVRTKNISMLVINKRLLAHSY